MQLPVMEQFYTIQGEGAHQGKAAYFVRLGGCDVGCVWCDVKDSWDVAKHPLVDISAIVEAAKKHPTKLVVITGGEPLMHNLSALTDKFKQAGFATHLETSGAHPLSGTWDWITFSPKKFKAALPEVAQMAHELKCVIFHPSDFDFAETHATTVSDTCQLFLQPEWSKRNSMMPLIVDYVKTHPKWRVTLQTHKYLDIP